MCGLCMCGLCMSACVACAYLCLICFTYLPKLYASGASRRQGVRPEYYAKGASRRQANSYLPRRMDYSGFWVSYFVVVPFGLLLLCAMLVDTVLRENVAFSRHVSNESFIVQMPNSGPSGSHAIPRQ